MTNIRASTLLFIIVTLFINNAVAYNMEPRILQQVTQKDIRRKIEAKIQEKANVVTQRNVIVSNISNALDQIKSLKSQLITAKLSVQNAYASYYNAKMKCDGYLATSNTIGIKGQISDQTCLQFPIGAQAITLYALKLQLQGYTADVGVAQKAFNIQTDFLADAATELAIYQDLKQYFRTHYNKDLFVKWSNQVLTFTDFNNVQKNIGLNKKQALDSAKSIQASTTSSIQNAQKQVTTLLTACRKNLIKLRTALNQAFSASANLNTQVKALQDKISGWTSQTGGKIQQLQKLTKELGVLVEQYATSVGATV